MVQHLPVLFTLTRFFAIRAKGVLPQHLVTLIGVGFSFGFKSAVGATMGFVRLQSLWLSVVRQPLTIQLEGKHSYWISTLLLRKDRNRNKCNVSD